MRIGVLSLVVGLGWTALGPPAAEAQTGGSAIVGVVRDESGAAVPGVTVEVASPALIERVKTGITDSAGEYQVVDLRAGTYTVTFTLPGFKIVRREGITIGTSFTATVNVTLPVGDLEETITVTGESPVVDVRSGVSERALTQQTLEGVPVARNVYQIGLLMPGATTTAPDVGGNQTAQITNLNVHGVSDNTWLADGVEINGVEADTVTATYYNQGFNQEMTVQTKALPAEAGGGVTVNMVKKEGSNSFKGDLYATFTGKALQGDNVSDEQRALGLVAPSAMDQAYDVNVGIGGPVARDRLWFYGSYRRWRVDRLTANTFNVDGTQALDEQILSNWSGRLSYRLNDRHRVSAWVETLDKLRGHRRNLSSTYQFISPEAAYVQPNIGLTASVKWTSTLSNTFLVEAGLASMHIRWGLQYEPDSPPDAIARNDLSLSTLTGAAPNALLSEIDWRRTATVASSWLPSWYGTHHVRVGGQYSFGVLDDIRVGRGDLVARYRNGVPDSVLVYNTPIESSIHQFDHALFAQDSWTIRSRLTINAGFRWQQFRGRINPQTSPAGTFVPERRFDEIDHVPNWKTVVPRLAVSYDLFGNGKTALKVSASKYTKRASAGSTVTPFNPLRLNSEVRSWVDANRDGLPQLAEIGPSRGTLTRGANVRLDPGLRRPYQWEYSASVEHELARDLGVAVSYYHRQFYDLFSTVNVALSASDYIPVTVTNPLTGAAFTIYNQTAASASLVDNVMTNSDALGSSYNGFEVALDKRMSDNFMLHGGFTVSAYKGCFSASTNPNERISSCGYDNFDSRYITNFSGIYRLPAGFNASWHVQQVSGKPLNTRYIFTRADVPGLTQVNQTVDLLPRGGRRKEAWTLLDLRLSRVIRVGRGSVEPLFEVYNITNESAALSQVETIGPAYGQISSNVDGRIVRLGFKVAF